MTDLWGFLLQTLTVSGAAVLLLAVKALFRDKLPPRWQFLIWGVLALMLLLPAGRFGRYVLLNWPMLVETLKLLAGESGTLTVVLAPVPLPMLSLPETIWDGLFLMYSVGVAILLLRYGISYIRLRRALRRGKEPSQGLRRRIENTAERYALPTCRAVTVEGIHSAFVCGVFSPVLVLPVEEETDEKVLLHELMHLKHHDVVWGLCICFFRCIHWCNPLLWYCANAAGNDLESLCDQRVLERLEGEERRDYGRLLLSMADERYARAPGTSSVANGGKNIRRRIEAIARFKRYPAGMALVSVCVAVCLTVPLVIGTRPQHLYTDRNFVPEALAETLEEASARTVRCTTPAGALDTYGKAVLLQNPEFRMACAPMEEWPEIEKSKEQEVLLSDFTIQKNGAFYPPAPEKGYRISEMKAAEDGGYEAFLIVCALRGGEESDYLASQTVRVEKEDSGRWVVRPLEGFVLWEGRGDYGSRACEEMPSHHLSARTEEAKIDLYYLWDMVIDNRVHTQSQPVVWMGEERFDLQPKPHAVFSHVDFRQSLRLTLADGVAQGKDEIDVGISGKWIEKGAERPELRMEESPMIVEENEIIWRGMIPADQRHIALWDSGHTVDLRQWEKLAALEHSICVLDLYIDREKTELTLRPEKRELP